MISPIPGCDQPERTPQCARTGIGMREFSTAGDADEEERRPANDQPDPRPGLARGPARRNGETTLGPARFLLRSGPGLGWGLLALGILSGLGYGLQRSLEGEATPGAIGATICGVLFRILAFGLAGWSAAVLCRLLGEAIGEHLDRTEHTSLQLMAEAARVVAALGGLAELLQHPSPPSTAYAPTAST